MRFGVAFYLQLDVVSSYLGQQDIFIVELMSLKVRTISDDNDPFTLQATYLAHFQLCFQILQSSHDKKQKMLENGYLSRTTLLRAPLKFPVIFPMSCLYQFDSGIFQMRVSGGV